PLLMVVTGVPGRQTYVWFILTQLVLGRLLILKILVVVLIGWVFSPQFRWNEFADALARTSTATALAVLTFILVPSRDGGLALALDSPPTRLSALTIGASLEAWLVGQCASQILPAVVGGGAPSFGYVATMYRPLPPW